MKQLTAELVFGIPPLPEPAPPPNLDLQPEDYVGIVEVGERRPNRPAQLGGPPPVPCPEAGPTDFPEKEATPDVIGMPDTGRYLWRVAGEQKTPSGTFILPESSERSIGNFRQTGGRSFTFVQTERELVAGSSTEVRSTFRVVPDDGIFLVQIVRKSPRSETVFAPTPEIEYLPLPARVSTTFDSVGVSESGAFGEALRHTGTVTKRHRVDACGKLVDSFFVEATQEFVSSSGAPSNRKYHYGIATQLGGMLVFEHVEAPSVNPTLKFDARIGQLAPSK